VITLRRLALFALCILALTGCQVRSWLTIDMTSASSGEVTARLGFDEAFRDAMGEFGGGADLLGEIGDDAPADGWLVERFTDGDIEGVTLSKRFASFDELQEILQRGIGSGPQEGLVQELSMNETEDTIRFEASLPRLEDTPAGALQDELQALLEVDGRIEVTFPGEVLEHNGELEGRTVTWTFDATQSGENEMFAEASKGGGFPLAAVIGVLLALGVIGLVAWRLLSERNVRFKIVSPIQRLDQASQPVSTPAVSTDAPEPTISPPRTRRKGSGSPPTDPS
jgi:hypothetical protein